MFNHNIERRTQSSSFIDAFARCLLTTSRCVRHIAKIACNYLKEQSDVVDCEKSRQNSLFLFRKLRHYRLNRQFTSRITLNAKNRKVETDSIPDCAKERKEQKPRKKKKSSSFSCFMGPLQSTYFSNWYSVNFDHLEVVTAYKTHKPKLCVLIQIVRNHYATAVNYCIYRLSSRSSQYDKMVPNYYAELVEKVKSQMKAHV